MSSTGPFHVNSYASQGGTRTTDLAGSAQDAEHHIEIRNWVYWDYQVEVSGQISGNVTGITFANGAVSWTQNSIVPRYSGKGHLPYTVTTVKAPLVVPSTRASSDNLCCHDIKHKAAGAKGPGNRFNPGSCSPVKVI